VAVPAFADTVNWTGAWNTRWRDGGTVLELTQEGKKVTGAYPLYNGRIEAEVRGRLLVGDWIEPTRRGGFIFTIAPDGQSFMGRFDSGEWWTGGRIDPHERPRLSSIDRSTPRQTLKSFLIAANNTQGGLFDNIGPALSAIDFSAERADLLLGDKIKYAQELFYALDQLTFRIWDIPAMTDTSALTLTLTQPATGKTFPLNFRREETGNNGWLIVPPPRATLQAELAKLLEFRGGKLPHPEEYLELKEPRSTMRTFVSEVQRWHQGGQTHVMRTMNLSQINPAIRAQEAELFAQYLKQILDRTGSIIWQEIPNDANTRAPYVHFQHPVGNIVIAPVAQDGGTVWQFTPETLASLRQLYAAFEDLPRVDQSTAPRYIAPSFVIRDYLRSWKPALLFRTGALENWQWIALVALLSLGGVVAFGLTWLILRCWFGRRPTTGLDRRFKATFVWPLRLFLLGLLWYFGLPFLGLHEIIHQVLRAVAAVLLISSGTLLAYNIVGLTGAKLYQRASETLGHREEILAALLGGVCKIVVIVTGMMLLAAALALPYTSVLAGLGIGGLAVALAARSTLENFLAGFILYADRPVSIGDFCRYGNHIGTVESIGLRSTRIRSLERTLVTVSNGEFVNLQLENFARRERMLLKTILQLRYETTPDQLRYVLAKLRELLRAHPRVTDTPARVRFVGFGAHSLDLEVFAYVDTPDWDEFLAIQEDIFLRMSDIVTESGTSFALPSQVYYIAQDKGVDAARTHAAEEAVATWRSQGRLPFPEFAPGYHKEVENTLDYPPAGSPDATADRVSDRCG
jgi:small-conductance mechanosensitive channel